MDIREKFFEYFSLDEESYAKLVSPLTFSSLPSIKDDENVKKTIARLLLAKERGEKVLIYGDYDCDGVMSSSILLLALRESGIKAEGYLPSRYLDGYGLTKENVDKIAAKGFHIIFTTDNGVTAHEALKEAKAKGLETIVLDHHEFDDVPPETQYLIHSSRCKSLSVPVSAGFLSFLFSESLLGHYDPYLLVLAGLSTLSDSMPLIRENRDLVRLTIMTMNEERYPEFRHLIDKYPLDETTIQFDIIPKINAVGRIEKGPQINRLLSYFTRHDEQIPSLAQYLNETNEKRKKLTKDAVETLLIDDKEPTIAVCSNLPEGLNGLLASRLLSSFHKPVAVFGYKERDDNVLVGSLRSVDGFDVISAMRHMNVDFLTLGGHPKAAGCSILVSSFPAFKREFSSVFSQTKIIVPKERTISLSRNEATQETYDFYRTFAPFGEGWKAPRFALEELDSRLFSYLKGGAYLSSPYGQYRLLSFSLGRDSFALGEKVSFIGEMKENEYRGQKSIQLIVTKAL